MVRKRAKHHHKSVDRSKMIYVAGGIVVGFLVVGFFLMSWLMGEKQAITQKKMPEISLLAPPPPPPPIEQEPPEPEPPEPEKEEIVEEVVEEMPQDEAMDEAADEGPEDSALGLDAEGDGTGDSFGLKAKKGGKSILGNPTGDGGLARRYAWYINSVERQIHDKIKKAIEAKGKKSKADFKTVIDLHLSPDGVVTNFIVRNHTGNETIDSAIDSALVGMRLSEQPPEEMPRGFRIVITSRG